MNRRNFILGLGTAATLSGAASVTGASITNTTQPDADFRVISAEQLEVRRNNETEDGDGNIDDSIDGYINDTNSDGYLNNTGEFDFSSGSPVYDSTGPNITLNSSTNADLGVALATPNKNNTDNQNASVGGNELYIDGEGNATNTGATTGNSGVNPFLVDNLGAGSAEVGVSYNYGSDGDTEKQLVNNLFQFINPDNGDIISPTGADGDHNSSYLSVSGGATQEVGLQINYSDAIASTLGGSFESAFGASGESNLNLLDSVEFGVNSN